MNGSIAGRVSRTNCAGLIRQSVCINWADLANDDP